jgi:hypothetical protein
MRVLSLLLAGGIVVLTGCATLVVSSPEPAGTHVAAKTNTAASLKIPPGHLPAPGMCRIWFPGKPPGHQPRPASCASLAHNVPPNAWLISRDTVHPEQVRVSVYDRDRPSVVVSVRFYAASSGKFLREL